MVKTLLFIAFLPAALLASTYEECLLLTEALTSGKAPALQVHRVLKESGHMGNFCSQTMEFEGSQITPPGIEAVRGRFYEVSYVYIGGWRGSSETYSIVREVTPSQEELKTLRADPAPYNSVRAAAENLQNQGTKEGYRVALKSSVTLLCPLGVVCDEKGPYRAYQYRGLNGYVSLFFNADVVNDMSLSGFKKHFNYISFSLDYLNALRSGGWKLTHARMFDSVLREDALNTRVKLHSFSNGTLQGEFEFTENGPVTWTNIRGECLDKKSAACVITVKGPLKIVIPFEFKLPDCRRVDEKGACTK